jgi:hypothetical protein
MDFVEQMFTTVRIEYTDGSASVPFLGSVPTRWTAKSFSVDGARRLERIQFGKGETGSVYVDDVSLVGSRTLLVGLPRRSSASKKKGASKPQPKA